MNQPQAAQVAQAEHTVAAETGAAPDFQKQVAPSTDMDDTLIEVAEVIENAAQKAEVLAYQAVVKAEQINQDVQTGKVHPALLFGAAAAGVWLIYSGVRDLRS